MYRRPYGAELSGSSLLVATAARLRLGAPLGPARLSGPSQGLTSRLGADVAPPRRPEAHGLAIQRGRREVSARDVQDLQREIEHDLHRQPAAAHDALQRQRASYAQATHELRGNVQVFGRTLFGC